MTYFQIAIALIVFMAWLVVYFTRAQAPAGYAIKCSAYFALFLYLIKLLS